MNRLDEWRNDAFVHAALAWADAALAREGRRRNGGPSWSRVRPWGTVLAIPLTDGDTVWFKATPEGSAEPILHQTLDAEIPEYVAPVLAADLSRGWLLMDDAGESLGNDAEAEGTPPCADPRFQRAMTTYAGLQEQLRHRIDELVQEGLPDARPHALPGVFDQLLASLGRQARDTGDEDASALLVRVAAARPQVVDLAASCAARAGSIDHNDLHPWNVLVRDGQTVFLDWGDAMAAHPYASLLVPVRIAMTESRRTAEAVLEAYARGRDETMDPKELAAVIRLSVIGRAWTWQRSLALCSEPTENDGAPLKWFARLLDPDPFAPGRD
jgi:aminoglycoside phosphotransferase (APT) family kinase protein